jgi:hypothetical protein
MARLRHSYENNVVEELVHQLAGTRMMTTFLCVLSLSEATIGGTAGVTEPDWYSDS